jgi:hypothetical protein
MVNVQIALGDSLFVVLQQPTFSHKENLLLHGISGSAQADFEPL